MKDVLSAISSFFKTMLGLMKKYGKTNFLLIFVLLALSYTHYTMISGKFKTELKKEIIDDHDKFVKTQLHHSVYTDSLIKTMLYELLVKLDADKIYIFQYHNGSNFSNGIPFLKASCIHEIYAPNMKSTIKDYQNLPVSMYSLWNRPVTQHEMLWCPNVDSLKNIDAIIYQSFNLQNSKSLYAVGIYDINETPIGFISLEYNRKSYTLSKSEQELLNKKSNYIASIMCYKNMNSEMEK